MDDSRETLTLNAFVAGHPVAHSRSPLIHGHWLKIYGINGTYRKHDVVPADFRGFVQSLKDGSARFCGGNVTIPHKEAAFQLADCPDEIATELGAANTLWLDNGRVHATNTDGAGFAANLDQAEKNWDQLETAVVLGAGGASRAIIQSVRDRGFKSIRVVNRTFGKAQELADRFGPSVSAHQMNELGDVMQNAGLFINTTSLGMKGEPVPTIDFTVMRKTAVVTDIVYVPLRTPMLQQAKAQGLVTVDGLGMLLHQAVPGFEKWFGRRPAVTADLRQIIIDDMERHL